MDNVEFELTDPPDGLTVGGVNSTPDGAQILLVADAAKLKPGLKGNLILNAFTQRAVPSAATKPVKPNAARQRVPLGTLPAVPYEVVSH